MKKYIVSVFLVLLFAYTTIAALSETAYDPTAIHDSVTTADIATSAVTTVEILDETIVSADIDDGTISLADMNSSSVDSDNIVNETIVSADIYNGTIVAADIATSAVTTIEILDGTILAGDIATSAVTTTEILNGTIIAEDLASNSVTTVKIADSNVTSAKITDGTIVSADIYNGTIVAVDIATGAVTTIEILDGTILADDIATGAITTVKIADINDANISNWNTAYDYSQITHLPLAGGILAGDINMGINDINNAGAININQAADGVGLRVSGFDDESDHNIQLYISGTGAATMYTPPGTILYMRPGNTAVGFWSADYFGFYLDKKFQFSQGSQAGYSLLEFDTAQTNRAFLLGLSDDATYKSRTFIICDGADMGYNFAHAEQANPTLFIHSATPSTTQWLGLTHDGTNGVISVGTGTLSLPGLATIGGVEPATNNTYYIGKNDDDAPNAFKGVILADTNDGKYYRIQITDGAIKVIDLTD